MRKSNWSGKVEILTKMKKLYSLWPVSLMFIAGLAYADVNRANQGVNWFKSLMMEWMPIFAAVGLCYCVITYVTNFHDRDTLKNWVIGLLLGGAGFYAIGVFLPA